MVKIRMSMKLVSMLCLSLCLVFSSCKQATKKALKEFTEEGTEEFVERESKKAFKEGGEDAAEGLLKRGAKNAIENLAEENKLFSEMWDRSPSSLRKCVLKSVEDNPRLLNILKSEGKLLDAYVAKGSKNALESSDLFSFFIASMDRAKSMYGYSPIHAIDLIDEGKAIKFVSRNADKRILGELKDGIFSIRLPDNGEDLFRHPLLKEPLIPNTSYKVKTSGGDLKYTVRTDALGRVSSIDGKGVTPHKLELNVLKYKDGVDLDLEKSTMPSSPVDTKVQFTYDGVSDVPRSAKLNLNGEKGYHYSDITLNKKPVNLVRVDESLLKNQGLSGAQVEKVIKECESNPRLKSLIAKDPSNAKRFLNTRNPVDKSLLAKTANGSYVPNYSYAGNIYYLDPALNPKLASRLKSSQGFVALDGSTKFSAEDLIRLHEEFPNGIPFSKSGHPDFTSVAYKRNGLPVELDLSKFREGNVDRGADINKANKIFRARFGFEAPKGYTWHHIEGTRKVLLVRTDFHQLIRHAGGISSIKVK